MTANPLPDFLTVKEAAAILRVGTMTIYRIVQTGDLPAYHFGERGSIRIERTDLYRYMRQSRSGR